MNPKNVKKARAILFVQSPLQTMAQCRREVTATGDVPDKTNQRKKATFWKELKDLEIFSVTPE